MLNIYLPGYSPKNQEDVTLFAKSFEDLKLDIIAYPWRHWTDTKAHWNPEIDVRNILGIIPSSEQKINIFAKSRGVQVATLLAEKFPDKVSKLILMGIPLYDLDDQEKPQLKDILKKERFDLYIIHHTLDSHGSWKDVQEFLNGIEYKLILKESDTHDYKYVSDIVELIK